MLEFPSGIKVLNPDPLDGWSGPYEGATEAEAKSVAIASIPDEVRYVTMEVKLIIANIGRSFWFESGITDLDFKEKYKNLLDNNLEEVYVQTYEDAVPYFSGSRPRIVFVAADHAYNDGDKSHYTYFQGAGEAFLGVDFNYKD